MKSPAPLADVMLSPAERAVPFKVMVSPLSGLMTIAAAVVE